MDERTANTDECLFGCVGHQVVGVLLDACPVNRRDLAVGNKTLIFEDGTGLTFSNNTGAYWRESADEIGYAIEVRQRELEEAKAQASTMRGWRIEKD